MTIERRFVIRATGLSIDKFFVLGIFSPDATHHRSSLRVNKRARVYRLGFPSKDTRRPSR